jgi:hypothetical protein
MFDRGDRVIYRKHHGVVLDTSLFVGSGLWVKVRFNTTPSDKSRRTVWMSSFEVSADPEDEFRRWVREVRK